jgi:hypothetical protein
VVTAAALVVVPSGPVSADQVSDLRTQATQVAQDLVLEQLQIGSYQQQAAVDGAQVRQDQAQIAATRNRIRSDDLEVARDRTRLSDEAVSTYIDASQGLDATRLMFSANQSKEAVRTQYAEVVTGDMNLTIDALHGDQAGLRAEQATLDRQQAQDQAVADHEATAS